MAESVQGPSPKLSIAAPDEIHQFLEALARGRVLGRTKSEVALHLIRSALEGYIRTGDFANLADPGRVLGKKSR